MYVGKSPSAPRSVRGKRLRLQACVGEPQSAEQGAIPLAGKPGEAGFRRNQPPIPLSRLAPVTLLTSVLHTRIVMIKIRLMPLEKAYRPISSK